MRLTNALAKSTFKSFGETHVNAEAAIRGSFC